jgi:hypothetical protein
MSAFLATNSTPSPNKRSEACARTWVGVHKEFTQIAGYRGNGPDRLCANQWDIKGKSNAFDMTGQRLQYMEAKLTVSHH